MLLFSLRPGRCQVPVLHRPGCRPRAALDLLVPALVRLAQIYGRTYDGPVSCAGDTKRIALYFPSRPLTQPGQPNPIHRILTLMAAFPAQIQTINKRIVIGDGAQVPKGRGRRTCEPLVKRPSTTWDREIPGCMLHGRDEWEPRCQFVRVVADEERAGLEVGSALRHDSDVLGRIKRVHV